MSQRKPLEIIGHGGAAGYFASNSEASIRKAIELCVDRIECDVIGTAGRDLVLTHDVKISFGSTMRRVVSLSLDELREIEPDILLLSDAFKITHRQIPLMLDIKVRHFENEFISRIQLMRATDDVSVSSTHARTLKKISQALPDMRVGLSRGHSLTRIRFSHLRRSVGISLGLAQIGPLLVQAKWCGATEAMVNHHICIGVLVKTLHAAGLRVYPWTVDHPADARRLIDIGVDGIISNYPDMVMNVCKEMGVPRL